MKLCDLCLQCVDLRQQLSEARCKRGSFRQQRLRCELAVLALHPANLHRYFGHLDPMQRRMEQRADAPVVLRISATTLFSIRAYVFMR